MEFKNCPKCEGEMKEGITKNIGGYAGKNCWGQGGIDFWGKIKENQKDIITYRCDKCGYLESYAN